MKKTSILILTFHFISVIVMHGQTNMLSGSFYRLENIDSLNKFSLDSIRGELQYYGINEDYVDGLIFPIVIYKTYDDWTGGNLFNFIKKDQLLVDYTRTKGKLINLNGQLSADLRYYKADNITLDKMNPTDSILRVRILVKPDSIWINGKLFKKDKTGRIFQRFTGY